MLLLGTILTLTSFSLACRPVTALRSSDRTYRHQTRDEICPIRGTLSPTPDEYMEVYETACYGGRTNNTARPMTNEELVQYYSSSKNENLRRVASKYKVNQECRREPTSWRFNYIDEDGQVLIREKSIDERSANILYMVRAVKPFCIDQFSYESGDPEQDARYMDLVAGPKFDDDLCGKQLSDMLSLVDELSNRSSSLRIDPSLAVDIPLTDQQISLAKILDSYGRYESGRLMGKVFSTGAYYQCRISRLITNQNDQINMRYCWAHLNYDSHLADSLRNRKRTKWEHPNDVLYTGMCIPESCHSKSFFRHKDALQTLVNTQFKNPLSSYIDENMKMTYMYCTVDDDSEFGVPLVGKVLLAFIVGWILLMLGVTIWNATAGKQASEIWQEERRTSIATIGKRGDRVSVLESLDLLESWRDFFTCYSKPSKTRAVQLNAVNFFKVFGCAFVVFGHTMALFGETSMDELRLAKFIENDWICCLILAGTLVVDSFFVITGILWAYFTLKRLNASKKNEIAINHLRSNLRAISFEKNDMNNKDGELNQFKAAPSGDALAMTVAGSPDQDTVTVVQVESWSTTIKEFLKQWFTYSSFRYLRIVPLYVLVHWFKKYVFPYVGDGPYWDHGFNKNTPAGACRHESPLTPFTFLAAYYPISRQCTLQSWSIANDMFFAFLAPPVILLIHKRPKVAFALSLVSCLLSYVFALDMMLKLPSYLDEELRELRAIGFYRFFDELSLLYTAPHFRIFNFVAGVWAGYALYHKQDGIDQRYARRQHQRALCEEANRQALAEGNQVSVEVLPPVDPIIPERIEWPGWFRGIATKLAFGYMLLIFVSFGLNETSKKISLGLYRWIYQQFVTSIRVFWSLANALVFLRMMTDWKDSLFARWSASKFWQIFSKLNYSILLIHLDLVLYTMYVSQSFATNFTRWAFFNLGAGIFMLCLPLSVFVFVFFENPFDKLIRSVLSRD